MYTISKKNKLVSRTCFKENRPRSILTKQLVSESKGIEFIDKKGLYNNLPACGKYAYSLLCNQRIGFRNINKDGGGVNANTDSQGRVVKITSIIGDKMAVRDSQLQALIGWLGNIESCQQNRYDGGHLLASSQGGPGNWSNMIPQDSYENRWGGWRQFERENIKNYVGHTLSVNIGYQGDDVRPKTWDAEVIDTTHINCVNKYNESFNL